ncbi:MAG TPA: ATP-binding protein, partial [Isosphaeraceae bacterium]|nr:ATP-binding protein [Isosphaeraceae bacterium]
MSMPILILEVLREPDVVLTRQRARQAAALLGFDPQEQTRVATAASEIARNAVQHGGGGRVEFTVEEQVPPSLLIRIRDQGPGVADVQGVLDGRTRGNGLAAARRLMDRFAITSRPGGGTEVVMGKSLPGRATPVTSEAIGRIAAALARKAPPEPVEEVRQQNQELICLLDALRDREAELFQINQELEETNRGVLALYAELDEKANSLRRASELKTRFLSNMSHEFRSPLNSIMSLTGFLLDRSDGDLSPEQEKQVKFIRKATEGLIEMVNDLLDLAKVEAGKVVVRPVEFELSELFSTLRGMIRPLLMNDAVALIFEDPGGLRPLRTDEGKVGQIVRNFLSNAVKFIERGEVRVRAEAGPGDTVVIAVSDTGVGIAQGDQARNFEEFGQVESPIQKRVQGTGLGLPLSKRLAELLGGTVMLRSTPGIGSTFTLIVPRVHRGPDSTGTPAGHALDASERPVLVVEDDPATIYLYEKYLQGTGFRVLPANGIEEARRVLAEVRPSAVVLDILLEAESGWTLLTELKQKDETRAIPILVLTRIDGKERSLALGADEFCLKPVDRDWLVAKLRALARDGPVETVLVVDDYEVDRYVLHAPLAELGYRVIEAEDGHEALRRAREDRPQAIFLDLIMPDLTGFEVLERLKSDPETATIPVIIHSSKVL